MFPFQFPKAEFFCRSLYVLTLTLALNALISECAVAQTQRPNIILILADDIGYNTLTCNGGTTYSTQNLDSLAQQGMRFTQCHASPLCSPSRFMLLTGKYNFRNYTLWGKLDTGQRTIGNMMKDAGYKTACYGKWQLDGGDASVRTVGFDNYCLWDPFQSENQPRYKNPLIYTNGAYVSSPMTADKYGEDIFTDSVLNFLDSNKSVPFFIYYPMVLAHYPFSPTPDDSDFSTWSDSNVINGVSDTSYYYSMIKYMDKKIGLIINKVKSLGIENNTVIIYTGDNGTPGKITEIVGDSIAMGQKGKTNELGTHVPLIAYWPGTINAGTINNDLVDFTDFLPTLAGIANIPVPTTYGPLDGISFSPRLTGQPGTPRDWIFCHYDPHPQRNKYRRWAQTATYKLYDTSSYNRQLLFYNISNDPRENKRLQDTALTADEVSIKQQLLSVINSYRAQGIPLLSVAQPSLITDSTALASATIDINGGSTVATSGVVWSTSPGAGVPADNYTSETAQIGAFKSYMKGLSPNTMYYMRPYAVNFAGIGYGKEKIFTTPLQPPHAITARGVNTTSFIAKWNSLTGAASYRLDVSTLQAFATLKKFTLTEGFDNGTTPPSGWKISSGIIASSKRFGVTAPSLQFKATGQQVVTRILIGPATKLSFWLRASVPNAGGLLVQGFNGVIWRTIDSVINIPSNQSIIKSYDATSNPQLENDLTQFRFIYTIANGPVFFDDVSINYNKVTPSFVNGDSDLIVHDTSQQVTGLTANKTYYYRVRAVNENGASGNSNVISAKACNPPVITSVSTVNLNCAGNNSGMIQLSASGVPPLLYAWTGPGAFTSSINNISNLEAGTYKIILTAGNGCSTDSTVILTEPPTLLASANADPILCSGGTTNLIATATGGTGNYHYALSNSANNVTGPQDDNQFVVSSGTYVVTVTDDNGCSFATDSIQIDEPPALTATASADIISCNGGTTTLTVTPQGGTGNYHYALSDGTGAQVDNHFTVAAGNYTVTVTDDNGCSFTTDTLRVTEPQALTASASANPILCIGGTTILTVTAQGGTGNYHYTLSDSANNTTGPQDDNHFTVTAGSYTATVTDDNGCLFTAESIKVNDGTNGCGGMVAVNSNQSRSGNITAKNNSGLNASIYPNPSSTAFTLRIQSNDNANVKITIVDVYGRKAYEAEGRGHDTFLFGAEFVPGTYLIKVMQGKNIKILKVIKQSD